MMGEPDEETLALYAPRGNYKKIQTSYSCRIECKKVVLCFGRNYMGEGLLRIIGMVRNEVKKRAADGLVERVEWTPMFSKTSRWKRKAQACEVDLTSAYASAALKIGAVTLKTYKRLMTYHKKTRLVAVGSLGTKRLVSTFKRGKLTGCAEVVEETRWVWDSIVAEVDRTMCKLMETAGDAFLHYWTDALFVKKGAEKKIQKAARALGYGTKKVYILAERRGREFKTSDGRAFPIMSLGGLRK